MNSGPDPASSASIFAMAKFAVLLLVAVGTLWLTGAGGLQGQAVERYVVEIIREFPHDTRSFTQGLIWCNNLYYESTGGYGESKLRKVRLEDGKVLREVPLPFRYFGEGLAQAGDLLFQLTWREGKALVYDSRDFKHVKTLDYSGEGWGLAFDGSWLIRSDGSDRLTFHDPETFAFFRRISVRLFGQPVHRLNELEYAQGSVYANIWQSTDIVRIDPATGEVTGIIDASSLPYRPRIPGEDVLNGIGYDEDTKTFLLTGKRWPKIYQVRFRPR